jgi:hypothetical protein
MIVILRKGAVCRADTNLYSVSQRWGWCVLLDILVTEQNAASLIFLSPTGTKTTGLLSDSSLFPAKGEHAIHV